MAAFGIVRINLEEDLKQTDSESEYIVLLFEVLEINLSTFEPSEDFRSEVGLDLLQEEFLSFLLGTESSLLRVCKVSEVVLDSVII